MTHKLILVASPAQAQRIASFLGPDWRVEATRGPVRELPQDTLGIEVNADFRTDYQVLPRQANTVRRLIKALHAADAIYLATAPDRDGEALAWHVLQVADLPPDKPVHRVCFTAITADAVKTALEAPRPLDVHLVEAQQARRIIDRLVGYLASPVVSQALGAPQAVGRVLGMCLRLLVACERQIVAFTPVSFWTLDAHLKAGSGAFAARLRTIKGQPVDRLSREQVAKLTAGLNNAVFCVGSITHSEQVRDPEPPFTTSTLLQAASQVLGLSPERTMHVAQRLYEAGFITYPRTDSVDVAAGAQRAALQYIARTYGGDYVPNQPHSYETSARHGQEGCEAIRPTDVTRVPDERDGDGAALYALIWRRFIASQMAPARYAVQVIQVLTGKTQRQPYPLTFEATGRTLTADGFLTVYQDLPDADTQATLPLLHEGARLYLDLWQPVEHQTTTPPRFTAATLVRALEQLGTGRPATYANAVQALTAHEYVVVKDKHLVPTAAGIRLCRFLVDYFPRLCDPRTIAQLEAALDAVACGDKSRLEVLTAFWADFTPQLGAASEAAQQAAQRRQSSTLDHGTHGQHYTPVTLHSASHSQGA